MKALLPVYCRPLGYIILVLSVFMPFLLVMMGSVTDANIVFYKECIKLLMMVGALMILFAFNKDENRATEEIRSNATRMAMFFTVLYVFGMMIYRVANHDIQSSDSTSFITFLIIDVLCYEFSLKKSRIDKTFKK